MRFSRKFYDCVFDEFTPRAMHSHMLRDSNVIVASPVAWNDLLAELTDFSLSLSAFRKLLKTVLFCHRH